MNATHDAAIPSPPPATSRRSPVRAWFSRHKASLSLAGAAVSFLVGLGLTVRNIKDASADELIRYTFGERSIAIAEPIIRDHIRHDGFTLLGLLLLLGACATVFAVTAYSAFGRSFSHALYAALATGIAAGAAQDGLLLWSLHRPDRWPVDQLLDGFWIHAPAALATVKYCALAFAALASPAAIASVTRSIFAFLRYTSYRFKHEVPWWAGALPTVTAPLPGDDDSQAAWRKAYWIPADPSDAHRAIQQPPITTKGPLALCLSGGGVRSACVAMGAMQVLSQPAKQILRRHKDAPFLDDFDYIVSVSGGGYSAGARLLGVQSDPKITHCPPQATASIADRFEAGSVEFDSIRRRSSYLADSPAALLAALGEVLKNLVASLLLIFLVAAAVGWTAGWFLAKIPISAVPPLHVGQQAVSARFSLQPSHGHPVSALAAITVPLLAATVLKCCALFCEWRSVDPWFTNARDRLDLAARGAALLAALVAAMTTVLPALSWLGSRLVPALPNTPNGYGSQTAAGLAGVVSLHFITSLAAIAWQKKGLTATGAAGLKGRVPARVIQLGIVLLTLGLLLSAWLVALGIVAAHVFVRTVAHPGPVLGIPEGFAVFVGLLVAMAVLSSVDVTSLSLHPFYRRRLARTFAVRRSDGVAQPYSADEPTWLDQYGRAQNNKPEFIFACAAAINDDNVRPAPGLNAVSFVLGANYIGGPALGWLKTSGVRSAAPPRIQRDLTVQAAVAVSGAAFASAMGRQNKGIQTVLALSGARLGTWLPNPQFVTAAQANAAKPFYPKALPSVRGAGYFYRELFGVHHADARLVQITDGGHYENLGLVEALRRKCRLIYCIDASGDSPPLLSGLDDAIRLAKFELGVQITFDESTDAQPATPPIYSADRIAAGSARPFATNQPFHSLNDRITADCVARATITYPDAANMGEDNTGCLIVAKAVLWKQLPDWILTYAADKDGQIFPHDKTSDQWFNEAQFATYTELGRRIAAQALTVPPTPTTDTTARPPASPT